MVFSQHLMALPSTKVTKNKYFEVYYNYSEAFSVQFSSVAQSCPTPCDPMNCSTPGLPVHYQLPEFTQTHVHQVSDAIQPSHPLLSPSPAPNPSQHQSFPMSQPVHSKGDQSWVFFGRNDAKEEAY